MSRLTSFHPVILVAIVALGGCSASPGILDETVERGAVYEPLPADQNLSGSIFTNMSTGLFADNRAVNVGDILVVQLVEQTDAEKSSSTSINRNSSFDVQNPLLGGKNRVIGGNSTLDVELDSDHDFSGASGSDQSNRLNGTVAVTVTRILRGGNLMVEGEKWISINRGREYIRLRGIVRPVDIGLDNVIASTRIANAEITYSGTGATADANQPGWLSRFFLGKVWPF